MGSLLSWDGQPILHFQCNSEGDFLSAAQIDGRRTLGEDLSSTILHSSIVSMHPPYNNPLFPVSLAWGRETLLSFVWRNLCHLSVRAHDFLEAD